MRSDSLQLPFGLASLLFAVGLVLSETADILRPGPLAQPLAIVLAFAALHFLRLPKITSRPDRRTGGLLLVPLVLGLMLLAIPILGTAYRFGPTMKLCGSVLLGSWLILAVWDRIRNRSQTALSEWEDRSADEDYSMLNGSTST